MNVQTNRKYEIAACLALGVLLCIFCIVSLPNGTDWVQTFSKVNFANPYDLNETVTYTHKFYNAPWTVFLIPHAALPLRTGNNINLVLNVMLPLLVILKYRGGLAAVAMTFISPSFYIVLATNNLEWVTSLAFLAPAPIAVALLTVKPQSAIMTVPVVLKKAYNEKGPAGVALILLPLFILVLASFVIWPGWLSYVIHPPLNASYNISSFPDFLPIGILILVFALKDNDPVLGALSTYFFAPYITIYALTPCLALLSSRYPKQSFVVWAMFMYLWAVSAKIAPALW